MNHEGKGLSALGLTMMALGTVVGGSFFLGSAIAIKASGPSVVMAYILGGGIVYFILFALSEMTVADPAPGSFRTFAQEAFGPGVGFVVGWVYWTGLILAMSSEATAVALFFRLWFPRISLPILGSIIIVAVTLLNLLGAKRLSKLESGLAAIKLLAIVGFIVLALGLISGAMPHTSSIGIGALNNEPLMPEGISGFAGSMLIVMFTYAGFEIIGLAASETADPHHIVPKAINYTVCTLVVLYTLSITVLLPLIPTNNLTEDVSPFVAALESNGIGWAADAINIVLVTAILSTMLAATFGLGRMMRSLAEEGCAPSFVKDNTDVPYKGIIFSGVAMLLGLSLSFFLPKKVYLFLLSSGGFSLLFTYLVILATHHVFRRRKGSPAKDHCQLRGFPYTSFIAICALIAIIVSMPLIPGQGSGLVAGLIFIAFYSVCYMISKHSKNK
ncbi:amino acid permease [Lutibacter sp. B2]|nr:amino acid permease [Lutibacter sp. B2]